MIKSNDEKFYTKFKNNINDFHAVVPESRQVAVQLMTTNIEGPMGAQGLTTISDEDKVMRCTFGHEDRAECCDVAVSAIL